MRPSTLFSALRVSWPPRFGHLPLIDFCLCFKRIMALGLAFLLLPMCNGELLAQEQEASLTGQIQSDQQAYPQTYDAYAQPAQAVAPLDSGRLQQLVAPIALYPDSLVALVLTASTYPQQVAEADNFVQSQGNIDAGQVAAAADGQNWDPSVKALTAFPQVLAQMDRNMGWTTDLGNAYYNQPSDVLAAVQVMRGRAQSAGTLQSTPQEAVNYVGGNIQLVPVNPQVVYVPAYNPWAVYGQPVTPYPGFALIGVLGSIVGAALHFGPGIAIGAFTTMPWGLLAWGLSWLANAVLFNNSSYYSHSNTVADWGFAHGGPRAAQYGFGRGANSYSRVGGGYGSGFGNGSVHRPPTGSYPMASHGFGNNSGRGFVPRPNATSAASVHRPPSSFGYRGASPNATVGRPAAGRPSAAGSGFVHRPPTAANAAYGRPPSSRGYQSSAYNRGNFSNNRAPVARPAANQRALSARLQRPSFNQRSTASYGGRSAPASYAKPPKSGGFRSFGGNHGSGNSFGGGHAPKMSKPKSYGGHGGGGGHSGGHSSGGKHRH